MAGRLGAVWWGYGVRSRLRKGAPLAKWANVCYLIGNEL